MNPLETNPDIKPNIGIQAWFKRTGDDIFINSPCVFTESKNLKIGEIYEIHDFTEPDEVKLVYIKILWVYLRGFSFHIIGVDITNGDLKLKSQRLNAPEIPCNFLICDLLYFDEDLVEKILRTFEEEDLLEFDFEGNE
jgi:hypothetical protein